MIVDLDLSLETPPYEQIRTAIATAVRRRQVPPGTRLPTVRQLARDLDVSPATVAHAYRELEHDGLIYGAGRKGTFVAEGPAARHDGVDVLAQDFVTRARRGGAGLSTILHAVIDALDN